MRKAAESLVKTGPRGFAECHLTVILCPSWTLCQGEESLDPLQVSFVGYAVQYKDSATSFHLTCFTLLDTTTGPCVYCTFIKAVKQEESHLAWLIAHLSC